MEKPIMDKIKNDKMFIPKIDELNTSAMIPKIKAENSVNISGLIRSQKYIPM